MWELIQRSRDALLATDDTVCLQRARLVTAAWREHEHEPVPVRRALAFAHVLANMDLDLESNPVFAGCTSSRPRAWMLVPEHGLGAVDVQVEIENVGLKGFLDGRIPADLIDYWRSRSFGGSCGIGHLAVDMDRVVHHGLESVLAEIAVAGLDGDADTAAYRRAMTIGVRAVIAWAERWAEAAEQAARTADDPVRRACLERVAAACRRVPAKPARNLFEGLQAMVLVQLALFCEGSGMSTSLGLPDRVLAPLVDDPFDAEEATCLVAAAMLKLAAVSLFGRGSKTQAITVGGADHLGRDQSNRLTWCFLEACDRLRVGDPHLFLRWHPGIDPALLTRACELLAGGLSQPLLIADPPTAAGFESAGVPPRDAWEYCVVGCNELGIPGRACVGANAIHGMVQHLEILAGVLDQLDDPDTVESTEALLPAMRAEMDRRLRESRRRGETHRRRLAEAVPSPFCSSLMHGCVAAGADFVLAMPHNLPGVYERGLSNAANALAALDQVVFGERRWTLGELRARLAADPADPTLAAALAAAPKWGCDDERADRWVNRLLELRDEVLDAIDVEFGDRPHQVCHVVRSLHHLDGRRIGATADGRRAGEPVGDSVGAVAGTARLGPLAVLRSVLTIDAARYYRGGYNLNVTLTGDGHGTATVEALVRGFFGEGGQELQINRLSAATLRAAQRDPARHGDLVVRFAGFTARFVDLSAGHQEELIRRAETGG